MMAGIMIENYNNWSEIDWKAVNSNVKRLRGRIYRAKTGGVEIARNVSNAAIARSKAKDITP